MPNRARITLAVPLAALYACRGGGSSFATPPGFSVPDDAAQGTLNRKQEVVLSPQGNHSIAAFRYAIASPGALIAAAKAANSQALLSVAIFAERSGNEPLAMGEKKAEADDLPPGKYYVAVAEPPDKAVRTRVELRTIFKPLDPDAAQQACKTQGGARELNPVRGRVEDFVDYSAQRRTCWWRVALRSDGTLSLKFNDNGNNITAELVSAQGPPQRIDPVAGLTKEDLPAGNYYVKVYADDAGDSGRYSLASSFTMVDTCKNEPHCSWETAEDLKLPADSKTADVDVGKGKQFHYYRANFNEKGKLTITFRVMQPRGSMVSAYFMKAPDDEGERVAGSVTKEIDQPGEFAIRVQAPEPGDYGKYAIQTIWQPANFIPAEVVEIQKTPVCMLTVSAGTNQGVRSNVACTILSPGGQAVDSCVVDQVFPNLSKVRPGSSRCNIAPSSKVQISGS